MSKAAYVLLVHDCFAFVLIKPRVLMAAEQHLIKHECLHD